MTRELFITKVYVIFDHPSYYLCSENKGADSYRTADLVFVFAKAKRRFSHDAAHIKHAIYWDFSLVKMTSFNENIVFPIFVRNTRKLCEPPH